MTPITFPTFHPKSLTAYIAEDFNATVIRFSRISPSQDTHKRDSFHAKVKAFSTRVNEWPSLWTITTLDADKLGD